MIARHVRNERRDASAERGDDRVGPLAERALHGLRGRILDPEAERAAQAPPLFVVQEHQRLVEVEAAQQVVEEWLERLPRVAA